MFWHGSQSFGWAQADGDENVIWDEQQEEGVNVGEDFAQMKY